MKNSVHTGTALPHPLTIRNITLTANRPQRLNLRIDMTAKNAAGNPPGPQLTNNGLADKPATTGN
jgi:hypothetical protein